ncbi:hypothetical protein PR048_032971 [Dryococelus australis]|uniref:HMG box domain-containing protein n=1 Tax=Dryococelus australis TaxID=614101 RepID=A0ABQ9G4H7_9NEOP|nr:hypothetical protein PR048_032971 [Dryococelus australis]
MAELLVSACTGSVVGQWNGLIKLLVNVHALKILLGRCSYHRWWQLELLVCAFAGRVVLVSRRVCVCPVSAITTGGEWSFLLMCIHMLVGQSQRNYDWVCLCSQVQNRGRMPRPKADAKPRGRMTAYAFFVQTCREEHKKKHPDENVIFAEFSKKCAERWKVSGQR